MATFYTSKKLSFNNAEQFKESFYEPEPATVGYVFIGNHVPYANESSPNSIVDSSFDEKSVWDNMYAAKRITGNDVELVIPRANWTTGKRYKQFDDKIAIDTLLTADSGAGGNSQPMYILTTARNVYKCLSNNANSISTVEPTGDYSTANGTIFTADGFIWKYMYNVKPSNRFLTTDWIPAPISTSKLDYNVSSTNLIDGELTTIIVTGEGTGYAEPSITATAFVSGVTTIALANTTNVVANMAVTGTGIASGTTVTTVNPNTSSIIISTATTANGGGTTANNLTFKTRVYIDGDGTGAVASANITNSAISKITVDISGTGYSYANAIIYGSGTSGATPGANTANARVIITPKFGHGFNPAKELDATNVMVVERIGAVDATENGVISTDTSFRQYGLLRDPYKYGNTSPVISSNAGTVISQTTNLTLIAGTNFELNEFVYQGVSANNAYFYGFVNAQSANEVRLTKVKGTVTVGGTLIGANSAITRTVVKKIDPEFQPYTGDILYVENVQKVTRADGQAENVKFVIRF
jgi:hypothetical protein